MPAQPSRSDADLERYAAMLRAIIDSVKEMGPKGAPEVGLYLAFQEFGIPNETFQQLVGVGITIGKIRKENHVLFYVEPKTPGSSTENEAPNRG